MGQGKSIINNRPLYDAKQFEEFVKISDQRYGDIKPLVHQVTRTQFAVLSRVIQNEEEFAHSVGELEVRSQLSHPQLVRLVNYNSQKTDEFCSTFFTEGLLYEYYSNSLKAEIGERRKVGAAYREGEIWYILDSLLSVVLYLQQQNICHGDIRPYNVLLTQGGEIKLGEIFKHKQSFSGFSQIVNQELNEFYVSPQLFHSLQNFQGPPIYDLFKSEVYSVGVTALEAATLENVSDACYDAHNFVIRQDQINRLLNQVRQQYSYQLFEFLTKLLSETEAERRSPAELFVELNQQSIVNQKTQNLSLIELTSQSHIEQAPYEEEEKVVRSAPSPSKSPSKSVINLSDDLNLRIEQAIAQSRDTIARYGTNTTTYTTNAFTTTYQVKPQEPEASARASQVQTRTYLNENTNNIETKFVPLSNQPLNTYNQYEEVVKRSQPVQAVPAVVVEPVVRQSQVQLKQSQQPVAQYTPSTVQYSQTLQNNNQGAPVTTTTYVSSQSTYTPAGNNYSTPAPPQEVTKYDTTTTYNFKSAEEQQAYINQILAQAQQQQPIVQGQGSTQITYTNYNGVTY